MDLATREVRQLTHGTGVADYEGIYLPDGDLLFNSTRCVQTVDCWWTEVSNFYRCDKNGQHLRRLNFDQVHDNFPTLTDGGLESQHRLAMPFRPEPSHQILDDRVLARETSAT